MGNAVGRQLDGPVDSDDTGARSTWAHRALQRSEPDDQCLQLLSAVGTGCSALTRCSEALKRTILTAPSWSPLGLNGRALGRATSRATHVERVHP